MQTRGQMQARLAGKGDRKRYESLWKVGNESRFPSPDVAGPMR